MSTEQLAKGSVRARENSVSLGGISSVVLGYLRLDGGATRVGVGKVSLFSDFIGGRPTVFRGEVYKSCSLCIICVNLRSVPAEILSFHMSYL